MADTPPPGDLIAAVAGALRGDRTPLRDVVADIQQRASERLEAAVISQVAPRPAAVRVPKPVAEPMPRPAPAREVSIRLPNGRRVRAMISPSVARRRDLEAIARVSATNDRHAFAALRQQGSAIDALRRSQQQVEEKVTALQQQSDHAVIGLVEALAGLRRRVREASAQATKAVAGLGLRSNVPGATSPATAPRAGTGRRLSPRARFTPHGAQQLQQLREARALALRTQIQNVTNVVHTVQAAAYGEKGSIFTSNNLLLAGNQLVWSSLESVLRSAGAINAAAAPVVAGLAALGTLVTGGVLLGDRQHERYVSGVSTFGGNRSVIVESLHGKVAEGFWPKFQQRENVPLVFTPLSELVVEGVIIAGKVSRGVLIFEMVDEGDEGAPAGRVAWTIDLGTDIG